MCLKSQNIIFPTVKDEFDAVVDFLPSPHEAVFQVLE